MISNLLKEDMFYINKLTIGFSFDGLRIRTSRENFLGRCKET